MAIVFAVLMAFPFGWCVGLLIALILAGREVGLLPIVTGPVGIVASLIFAVVPISDARTRLTIMLIGTPTLYVLFLAV